MLERRCIVLLCIIGLTISLAATASPEYSPQKWQKVFEEFGLQEVDHVPAGITPLRVESPGELRRLLSGMAPQRGVVNITASDLVCQEALSISPSLGIVYSTVELETTNSSQWPIIFHLTAEVTLAGSGSFWEIYDCDERSYFTGWEGISETGGEWADSDIAPNKQSVQIDGGGYIKHYIWTTIGKIHVMTYWFEETINYSLY